MTSDASPRAMSTTLRKARASGQGADARLASMLKTFFVLATAAVSAAAVTWVVARFGSGGWLAHGVIGGAALAAFVSAVLALCGWVTIERQRRLGSERLDAFVTLNATRSEASVVEGLSRPGRFRKMVAQYALKQPFVVGDRVRVRPLTAIRATLDEHACFEGLPFMAEMAAHCGREFTVYRVVDKIYDYGRTRRMRRLDDAVLLTGQRCDGAAHGGCEAACYLIWKSCWLEPAEAPSPTRRTESELPPAWPTSNAVVDAAHAGNAATFSCQYTRLSTASRPMAANAWRALIAPLVLGNVSAPAFALAMATRVFNGLQRRRGGAAYPARGLGLNQPAPAVRPLQPGEWVRIRTPDEIAATLNASSKHRGLWFDPDMLKFSGRKAQVRGRVTRIIDAVSGQLVTMKTPCVVMEEVHYTGEFQGFGEQHDFLYWREHWLAPLAEPRPGA